MSMTIQTPNGIITVSPSTGIVESKDSHADWLDHLWKLRGLPGGSVGGGGGMQFS